MTKIKVLFIVPSLKGGGAERVISYLVNHITSEYFEPILIIIDSHSNGYELKADIKKYELNIKSIKYSFFAIRKIIKAEKPAIVFSTLTYLNTYLGLLRFVFPLNSVKFVARESTMPSINNRRHTLHFLYNLLTRIAYRKFDQIICQSNDMTNDLIVNFKVNPSKLITINNPIDSSKFINYIENVILGKNKGSLRLVTIAMLRPEKGINRILEALSFLDINFKYFIVGEGSERTIIEKKIKQLGLSNKVRLLGFQTNPSSIISKCDIFLQGSYYEGFPNVLLEASLLGLPIVAFNSPGGTKEVIFNGNNGYLVEDDNKTEFNNAIKKIISQPLNKTEISSFIQSRFGLKQIIVQDEIVLLNIAN
jgi:glycosyltransferase involved in cell wall biosynthesis